MRLFKNLFHLSFMVNDLEKSLDFYCNKLGFERMFTINCPGTDEPWLTYVRIAPEQYLELFPVTMNNPYIKLKEAKQYMDSTFFHFALQVESLEDTARELRQRGVEMLINPMNPNEPVTTDPLVCHEGEDGCRIGWLVDPDGNKIEVMEQTGNTTQQQFEREHPIG